MIASSRNGLTILERTLRGRLESWLHSASPRWLFWHCASVSHLHVWLLDEVEGLQTAIEASHPMHNTAHEQMYSMSQSSVRASKRVSEGAADGEMSLLACIL